MKRMQSVLVWPMAAALLAAMSAFARTVGVFVAGTTVPQPSRQRQAARGGTGWQQRHGAGNYRRFGWMYRVGIGGMQMFDGDEGALLFVDKPVIWMSLEWKSAWHHAASEADRLHPEMSMAASREWSETAGPWGAGDDMAKRNCRSMIGQCTRMLGSDQSRNA